MSEYRLVLSKNPMDGSYIVKLGYSFLFMEKSGENLDWWWSKIWKLKVVTQDKASLKIYILVSTL